MQQLLLGPSGLRVSELCLGTLNFGESKSWGADAQVATDVLKAFADAGGTFIDTAPNYSAGTGEEIVGAFLAGQRDRFVVGTKFTASNDRHPLAGGNSRRSMVRSVEASLKRLGTDYIDLLWLHYWDGTTPAEEIMRALDDLTGAGKILYTGFSDTPAWLVSRAVTLAEWRGWNPPIAIQAEYNVTARTAERELLPMADAFGLGVLCWGAMAAGALAGGEDPQRRKAEAVPPELVAAAGALAVIAQKTGLSQRSLALRWLMQPDNGCRRIPLVGARTVAQIDDTIAEAGRAVDASILAELNVIAPPSLGFPHELIGSAYLRKLALGDPANFVPPGRPRR